MIIDARDNSFLEQYGPCHFFDANGRCIGDDGLLCWVDTETGDAVLVERPLRNVYNAANECVLAKKWLQYPAPLTFKPIPID